MLKCSVYKNDFDKFLIMFVYRILRMLKPCVPHTRKHKSKLQLVTTIYLK